MNQNNAAFTEGNVSCGQISFSAMRHVCSYTCPANRFRNSTHLALCTSSIQSTVFIWVHIFLFRMWLALKRLPSLLQILFTNSEQVRALTKWGDTNTKGKSSSCPLRHLFIPLSLYAFVFIQCFDEALSANKGKKVNVTLPLCLISDHVINTYRRRNMVPRILKHGTRDRWSASCSGHFNLRYRASTAHHKSGWVDLRANLGAVEQKIIS